MIRIIGIFLFILFAGNTFAQKISQSNVPAVVVNAFQIKYPNAEDVKWKLEKGNYRVDFKMNSKSNKLVIDYKGSVLKHAQDLFVSEIPKVVQETIRKKVVYFDISDADKFVEGDNTTYEIKFGIDGKDNFFWINEKGELQKYRKELKISDTPSAILKFIRDQYSSLDIKRSKYVEESGNINYIVGGELHDKEHVFWFDRNSTLLKHTRVLRKTEIPGPVLNDLRTNYKDYEIEGAKLEEVAGKRSYLLEIKKSRDEVNITYSPDGKVLEVK